MPALKKFKHTLQKAMEKTTQARVEALNRAGEFKSALGFHVAHFIVMLEVSANKVNAGCTFFSSSASTDCYLRAL
jgi:hypothetical protein